VIRIEVRGAAVVAVLALVGALGACGKEERDARGEAQQLERPVTIGAAVGRTGATGSLDGPALAAAQVRAEQLNRQGGVDGRRLEFEVRETRLDARATRRAALDLVASGAEVVWVTCDPDASIPPTQVASSRELLALAPCTGNDRMGSRRLGEMGRLAFSFGNAAQDEGAALARLAADKGFRTASVVTERSVGSAEAVCRAFTSRFEQLGGKVVVRQVFREGDGTIGSVIGRVARTDADAIAICATPRDDLTALVSGLRGAGDRTPIVGPSSLDGERWLPRSPRAADDIHVITSASVHGDDPSPRVRELIAELERRRVAPVTGGFVAGAAAVDGLAAALRRTGGSTDGPPLARALEGFSDLPTIAGELSFSEQVHTAFGGQYRVIEIHGRRPRFVGLVEARRAGAIRSPRSSG
jgi:branched-chain amino acid transport system substrate-binding protein